ncbi:MAG TPA: cation-translocating P-type ATPase [Candidatus Acidoferrum sp.]
MRLEDAGGGVTSGMHESSAHPAREGTASDSEGGGATHEHGLDWRETVRIGFVAIAAGIFWFLGVHPSLPLVLAGVSCAVVGGYPIFREAIENILERRMTMELSMAIAILAALAIREVFTALVITLFVLVAEVLEGLTVSRGRHAIRHLIDLLPSTATVNERGGWRELGVQQVLVGDIVLIKPGSRIPVDGSVVGGHSFVDQATITGESMPVEKNPGKQVYAGTINQSGALEVRVERLGRDTTFGKIIQAVEQAEQSRAPIQRIADRLAGYLVYFAFAAAILTLLVTHNMRSTISVIIVAGACGIAAGTPLAILGAIGRAAQQGAIIKGGLYLEKLAEVDTILLDKTGTLTFGTPRLLDVHPAPEISAALLLKTAAMAESRSEHPVAKAILKKAIEMGIGYEDSSQFEYTPGRGVSAICGGEEVIVGSENFLLERGVSLSRGNGRGADAEVFVARQGKFLGTLVVADLLRPEAKEAIGSLKSMGLRTVLLTGDAQAVAEDVGKKLGVHEVASELLPEEKLQYVKRLAAASHTVAMVGDGVNDAPALAQATVGVAMGSGTDVAQESADVVLIGSDLSKLVETLRIARRCRRTIMQNFVGTLVVDTIGMGMAAFGLLNPLLAAFIHVSSELVFILNSARLVPSATLAGALSGRPLVQARPDLSQSQTA